MKSLISAALVALPLALGASAASAQAYPSKPIRWLVPYPAGGGADFLARTIGQQLSTQIGQPVVIENKPGGNTAIAASEVARAPADGYTMLSADNGTMTFNTALYGKLTYNPDKDLTPVTLMGRFPMILVVGPWLPMTAMKQVTPSSACSRASAGSPARIGSHWRSAASPMWMAAWPRK